ncbi:MAG: GNAT family N-acetyltransferase [Gammaproteobacteria bacterium]|nr:GNAT family N-acetyltransferase [Gammaproteobacteria bacterium]
MNRRLDVREVPWTTHETTLIDIRTEVFVKEQQVPKELEIDGLDCDSFHFLASIADEIHVGTARLMKTGQIGRMAVLQRYRNHGIGRQLLECAIAKANRLGFQDIFLHAQTQALSFYLRNGFEAFGPEFDDAGISHRAMRYIGASTNNSPYPID